MLTKIQTEIMKVFVSKIDRKFSINEISRGLKKPYALIHRSMQELIKNKFILKDEKKLLSINYKENLTEISFIESIITKNSLEKDKSISLFIKDCINGIKEDYFTLLIFDNSDNLETAEKTIKNIASNFSLKIDLHVINKESAHEMFSKRERINILNESLNKHLIAFGAENYYRILSNARR